MKQLFLADLAGLTEKEIHEHISESYEVSLDEVQSYKILVAYESVGSWGCDSSSFFLLEKEGKLYENHAGHCSCYGFEGQFSPEETTSQFLKERLSIDTGGYDPDSSLNEQLIKQYFLEEL